jgi:hypothetical protein
MGTVRTARSFCIVQGGLHLVEWRIYAPLIIYNCNRRLFFFTFIILVGDNVQTTRARVEHSQSEGRERGEDSTER